MQTKTITLMNGNTLECEVGKPFVSKTETEIHKGEWKVLPIFKNFAWFLLENADRIMSDSRMFLCPIYSQVFSPFFTASRPRLGTFIEWWTQCPDVSRDKDGNPIYYISGNPMTGSHACCVVNTLGDSRMAREKRFMNIVSSFSKVNNLYMDVKADGAYYDFEEVLRILCGDTYEWRRKAVDYKIELDKTRRELSSMEKWNQEMSKKLGWVIWANREMIFDGLKEKIIDFAVKYLAVEKSYVDECHKHGKFKKQEREKFKKGEYTPEEYDALMQESSKQRRTLKKELSDMGQLFMFENFGKNPNEINLEMVLDYAKHQINKC